MHLFIPTTTGGRLLLILLLATIAAASDHYLLSCGAPSAVSNTPSTYDGQTWHSDKNSTFSDTFSSTVDAVSTASSANVPNIPFSTARIFTKSFTYSFPVSPGPKFIRLFFSPATYSSVSPSDSYLTLRTNTDHLLLRNFSAYLSTSSYMFKEFYVVANSSLLQLTFSPTPPATHAFLNGIEIVSVPDTLYTYVSSKYPMNLDTPNTPFDLNNATALETAYRLNVGGNDVNSNDDAGGMHRQWANDETYLAGDFNGSTGFTGIYAQINYTTENPAYTAPVTVYQTFRWMGKAISNAEKTKVNVTWGFEVDFGFNYLLRLHWAEVTVDIIGSNYRVFDVYVDGLTAEKGADVYEWAGANTAIHRDYVVYVDGGGSSGSRGVLQLAMHPESGPGIEYTDILLNGLEIFKLSRPNGSLDAPNPIRPPTTSNQQPLPPQKIHPSHVIPAVLGAIAGVILVAVIIFLLFIIRRRNRSKLSSTRPWSSNIGKSKTSNKSGSAASTTGSSTLPSDLCRRFSVTEIRRATLDFNDSLIIGHGGFGNVYKGTVAGGEVVAIKRLNPLSKQGAREFTTEIDMLSKLRHVNLVSLIGFCDDAGEMILVYEYMPRGTLRDHIFPSNSNPNLVLTWPRRLEICLGAARGLHYLHAGAGHMIIHRDVKSTNILLDSKWTAKMSDFGLSKLGPIGGDLSHVSTVVKGSFGYVDPEYYRRQQLTEKSDVYSFGVVLFEVLCGRAAVGLGFPKEEVNLAVWGRKNHLCGTLQDIVYPSMVGEIAPECLKKFGEVAESCVRDVGSERPSMGDVVWGLEFALQLQREAIANGDEGWASPMADRSSAPLTAKFDGLEDSTPTGITTTTTTTESGLYSGSSDQGGSTTVFSQIFKPQGR